jgi:Ser/Thr protein kinase RdoA (MazF antagonist)
MDLIVPAPVLAPDGELVVQAAAPGIPEERTCSLFRWMRGRKVRQGFRLWHFGALGRLMANLHNHAARWQVPAGFTRRHWDWEGLFGKSAGFNLAAEEVWALMPQPYDEMCTSVANQAREVMDGLGKGAGTFGLIHADLFLGGEGNVLFASGEARPIDFDDCGWGYWIYDLAVPLAHWRQSEAWPGIRDSLLDGYAQVRPLPKGQLAYLELFMAARHVSEVLWGVDMAQGNPSFREHLPEWLDWAGKHIDGFLRSSGGSW